MIRRAPVTLISLAWALAAVGCGSVGHTPAGEADSARGKELFVEKCGSCHKLADANTPGTIGPDLDEAIDDVRAQGFEESTIRDVVRGQIAYPVENPPTGLPGMPADLVTGEDAVSVAAYVASVAGRPVQGQQAGGGAGGATDGKEIFASAGCGSCHTLADAGTTGTIGPNLDQSRPTVDLAIERVTKGSGAMPSFADQLSEAQIRAVAEYVAEAAGK